MLKQSGVPYTIVEYLKTPFSESELDTICVHLGKEPTDILRPKDKMFKELNLSKKDKRSRKEWIKLMVENPSMIERPIVKYKGKYTMGRPPESLTTFLKDAG